VIGTLAVDWWAVTFGAARRGLGGLGPRAPPSPLLAAPYQPSTASAPTSYYSMWHYNYLYILKGQADCHRQTDRLGVAH